MKKILTWVVSVLSGVIAIEFMLSYTFTPIASINIVVLFLIITVLIALFGFILWLFQTNANKERETTYNYNRMYSEERSNTNYYNLEQSKIRLLDNLVARGAELKKLPSGEIVLNFEGKSAHVTEGEIKYLLGN